MNQDTSHLAQEDAAIGLLTQAVRQAGGEVRITACSEPMEAMLQGADGEMHAILITTRVASPALERVLELLALALWRRTHGNSALQHGLVIRLPRLPVRLERWVETIERMLAEGAVPGSEQARLPFALCSELGGYLLRLPGLAATMADPDSASAAPPPRGDIPQHDAALRAMKLLLAQMGDHTQRWWGGAREPITTGLQLARLAQTSSSGIYALLESLAQRGWIRKGYGRELRLLDVPAVLGWWLDHARHQQRTLLPVRPLYPPPDSLASWSARCRWLREHAAAATGNWAISGWAACQLLKLSILQHPEAKPFTLTSGRSPVGLPGFLHEWQLVECDARDAVFWIEATATHRAALFAAVPVDGLNVVDGWQAALDVAGDPDRGDEQARAIAERLWPA